MLFITVEICILVFTGCAVKSCTFSLRVGTEVHIVSQRSFVGLHPLCSYLTCFFKFILSPCPICPAWKLTFLTESWTVDENRRRAWLMQQSSWLIFCVRWDLLNEFCDSDMKWSGVLRQQAFDMAWFSQKYTQGNQKKLIKNWSGDYLRPLSGREARLPFDETSIWICKYILHMIGLGNSQKGALRWGKI